MKTKKFLFQFAIILLVSPFLALQKKAEEQRKVAIIVAIANYPTSGGWTTLSSLTDDTLITQALIKKGFEPNNILHVTDKNATYEGIKNSFKKFTENYVKKGDMVYIHFSSHGQQIMDQNGDEWDKLDEAIVCYDAKTKYENKPGGYKGEKHLRDDELGIILNKIRIAAGENGNIWVVSDACHSGNNTRAEGVARGNMKALVPDTFLQVDKDPLKDASAAEVMSDDGMAKAKMVMFSAARSNEINYQFENKGSLTYAVVKALEKASGSTTYEQLFGMVEAEMSKMKLQQTPVLEGISNTLVFSGKSANSIEYFKLNYIKSTNINIQGGKLLGLYPGTKVCLMPAGSASADPNNAVYNGVITYSDNFNAEVRTGNVNLRKYKEADLWVFVTEKTFGDIKLKIKLHESIKKELAQSIKNKMAKYAYIEFDNKNPELVIEQVNGKYNLLLRSGEKMTEAMDDFAYIESDINTYLQNKLMLNTDFADPSFSATLDFNVVAIVNGKIIRSESINTRLKNGVAELHEEEIIQFVIKNTGTKNAYFSIFEFAPNGTAKLVLPFKGSSADEFMLAPGETKIIPKKFIEMTAPFGFYTYKLFATPVPVNFMGIMASRGADDKTAYKHPLENMLKKVMHTNASRSEQINLETSGNGTTVNVAIRVVP